MLKSHNGIAEWLWDIVNKCWTEENLPQDWKLASVVPLFKNKGKRSECGNYLGISLLSVSGKIFASIILNRWKNALDQVLREEQCGFRKSRGCSDQLFALRQILEKCMAFQLDVSFCFIDFRAAFDSVDSEMMYKMMKHYGLPPTSCECHPQQLRRLQVLRQGGGREGPDVRRKTWCSAGRCMVACSLWPCDELFVG